MPVRTLWLLAIVFAAAPAQSADGWGGSLAVTSDYFLRGVSQSNGSPAAQGDVHYGSVSGWSAGLWASTVKLNPLDAVSVETNIFLGFAWPLSDDLSAKVQAVHYSYPINRQIDGYDYDELAANLNYRDSVYFTLTYSPDTQHFSYYGLAKNLTAVSSDLQLQRPIFFGLSASAGVGFYRLADPASTHYWYWNAGVGYSFQSLHVDVSYIGAGTRAKTLFYSEETYSDAAGHHWAATLVWRF